MLTAPIPSVNNLDRGAEVLDHVRDVRFETRALRAQARALRAQAHAHRATWLPLMVGICDQRSVRTLAGGSDGSDVASTIREAFLCWRCIASKSGLLGEQLDDAMMALTRQVRVNLILGPCDGCQRDTLLYRLA